MATDPHLMPPPAPVPRAATAQAMAGLWGDGPAAPAAQAPAAADPAATAAKREAATESIGRRAGSLSDEIDFPEFVASLIHGTFDAMVDSSIRQMEAFGDLIAAVAKPVEQFRDENVTANQARDWLVAQHPADLQMVRDSSGFGLQPRPRPESEEEEPAAPTWLADYGLADEELTPELIEESLVPAARDRIATDRMQTLATMVMLGLNRIIVKDGTIAARLRFRAAAADHAKVDYAVSDDAAGGAPPASSWATRGSTAYAAPSTKVSTVGVNSQTDSDLKAELFGEVKINFASETLPLDRFVDDAKRVLLERAARPVLPAPVPAPAATPAPPPVPAIAIVAPSVPVTP
ncbi:MAG TPA: hypothetical protein VK472_01270 [Allosphingosinicella sp.]|nr:hypothetical protein [Allosphingosinicella sp.]